MTFRLDPNAVPNAEYHNLAGLESVASDYLFEEVILEMKTKATNHLLDFIQFTFPGYQADRFHEHLTSQLEQLVFQADELKSRGLRGCIINAPPQHGKSEIVSVRLPPFWLAHRPDDPVILTSYSAALATYKSKTARGVINSEAYRYLFPEIKLKRDSHAADFWELEGHRGYVRAGGVDGPLTGFGAKLAIIDDPFKNWAEAQSKTVRERVWDWYRGSFLTRLAEDGFILLMMTRWHEDDLCGRLLEHEPDQWILLKYQALCEDPMSDPLNREKGEALAPSRYSEGYLRDLMVSQGSLVWSAEYQQEPTPPGGALFQTHKIQIIEAAPVRLKVVVRYWDLAATEESVVSPDPDYVVGTLIGLTEEDLVVILDQKRARLSPKNVEDLVIQTAHLDGRSIPIYIEQEAGASGKSIVNVYSRKLLGWQVHGDRPSGSKVVRAQPFAAQVEAGNVLMVKGPWNKAMLDEMSVAPNGAHDDTWDTAAGGFNQLVKRNTRRIARSH